MKKTRITIFTALVLCFLLVLGACGQGGQSSQPPSSVSSSKPSSASTPQSQSVADPNVNSNFNELGTFPIVKEKETINVYIYSATPEFNPETNWMTPVYEEKTNVHVNWSLVPQEQYKERVNIAFASGEDIDMVFAGGNVASGFNLTEILKFAQQGVLHPLNDLIDNHSIHMKKNIDEYEGWREVLTLPDGEMYTLPRLNDCDHCKYYTKMWINLEWLKNVNLEIPTTTEEFRQMLLAFRDQDANGNGDPNDEIPMAGAQAVFNVWNSKVDPFLMNAFIYDDGENRLFLRDGKVIAAYNQPEWREGLRYLNSLFSDGLIYIESFTMDKAARDRLNSQKFECTIGAMPSNIHFGTREVGEPQRWTEYLPIKPIKGPTGYQTTRYDPYLKYQTDRSGGFIPATSKKADLVVRWLDYFHTYEGLLLTLRGEEGVGWEKAAPDATGISGKPAVFTEKVIPQDHPFYNNFSWMQAPPMFQSAEDRTSRRQNKDMLAPGGSGVERFLHYYTIENYVPYGPDQKDVLPPLYYGEDTISEMAQLVTNINNYVEESLAKFIIGELNLDTDWDKYIGELNNLGFARYLEIVQSAYNTSSFVK